MRAVNQAIGRAIRHKGDHAAIVLLDRRWCGGRGGSLRARLPGWIGGSVVDAGFEGVMGKVGGFFAGKRGV